MQDKDEVAEQAREKTKQLAARRASARARNARWDLDVALFLFAILILVLILVTYTKMGIEVVAPIAIFGLAMVWLVGWRRGRQLQETFYYEELAKLERELKEKEGKEGKEGKEKDIEETIEERVQKALRERWR